MSHLIKQPGSIGARICFMQFWGVAALCVLCMGTLAPEVATDVMAADEELGSVPLLEREPFDRLTLNKENNNEVHETRPIEFPNRRVPAKPRPTEKLKGKLLEDDSDFEVEWFKIEKVELYEDMILAEANKLVAEDKLDEAFDYFSKLLKEYPGTEGLGLSHQNYLYRCVVSAVKAKRYDEALGVLEELYRVNPNYKETESSPPLMDRLARIAETIIGDYIARQDFRSAKTLLRRLESKYNAGEEPFVKNMRGRLAEVAARHRDEAKAHLAAGRFVDAYDACAQMIDVWPFVEGGSELAAEISRRYPLVMVGVSQPALAHDPRSLNNPSARRTGRLVERRLMEFSGRGTEGGKYTCSLGSVKRSDDGLRLTFSIGAQATAGAAPLTGYDVSRRLLDLADPASPFYQPPWARLMEAVRVRNVTQVEATLRLPHVLPEAFLQTSYQRDANLGQPGVKGSGPYFLLSRKDTITRFSKNDQYPLATPGQPAEMMERFYSDPRRALLALQRGEVDMLDQVFPSDILDLQANEEIVVARYSVPTTHFITILRKNPYLANDNFRRALVYGSNREAILKQGLLKGAELPGYRTVSGPFPAPVNAADAYCYGYDDSLKPRDYEPKLAMILKIMATNSIKSHYEKLMQKAPVLAPLVLGHPSDEVSRLACKALGRQWEAIGIKSKLVEFPQGVFTDEKGECDMVYVQAATWEPVVDAARLFATWGLSPTSSTYINLALRDTENAKDWNEARDALLRLHREVHDDVTIIPLYQMFDYYAYRKSVQGLADGQVTLYQNVEKWQVSARFAAK